MSRSTNVSRLNRSSLVRWEHHYYFQNVPSNLPVLSFPSLLFVSCRSSYSFLPLSIMTLSEGFAFNAVSHNWKWLNVHCSGTVQIKFLVSKLVDFRWWSFEVTWQHLSIATRRFGILLLVLVEISVLSGFSRPTQACSFRVEKGTVCPSAGWLWLEILFPFFREEDFAAPSLSFYDNGVPVVVSLLFALFDEAYDKR